MANILLRPRNYIGKARRFNHSTNTISITHWKIHADLSLISLYPTPDAHCTLCSGCTLNSNRIQNTCTLDISATLSTKFLGRKIYTQSTNKLQLNANYLDLLYSIASHHFINIPPLPQITIYNNPILDIFLNSSATSKLQTIAQSNAIFSNFSFYTNGSVVNISDPRCTMEIAWIQVFDNQISHSFSAQIQNWPSSYKAELIAILSAISTCPRNSNIHIYTDSLSIISKYNTLNSQIQNYNKLYSYNYWPIWHTLLNLIKSLSLNIIFHKVQVHSNDIYNNKANELAKNHYLSPILEFQPHNLYNPFFSLIYKKYNIEQPTQHDIKNICNAHIIAMWSSQYRIQQIIPLTQQIDWNATWLHLNHNHKCTYNYTNFQLCSQKSFQIKCCYICFLLFPIFLL